jgi:hypothetical protein
MPIQILDRLYAHTHTCTHTYTHMHMHTCLDGARTYAQLEIGGVWGHERAADLWGSIDRVCLLEKH